MNNKGLGGSESLNEDEHAWRREIGGRGVKIKSVGLNVS